MLTGGHPFTEQQVYNLLDDAYDLSAWISLWIRDVDTGVFVRKWCERRSQADSTLRMETHVVVTEHSRTPVLSLWRGEGSFVDVYYPAEPISKPGASA